MSDYISRETAIKKIKDYGQAAISSGQDTLDPVDDIICIAGYIEMLPAADVEPVRRWIPCSERLPEICIVNGEMVNYLAYLPYFGNVDIANYHPDLREWLCCGLPGSVSHWKPLPEPPKEGGPEHG